MVVVWRQLPGGASDVDSGLWDFSACDPASARESRLSA